MTGACVYVYRKMSQQSQTSPLLSSSQFVYLLEQQNASPNPPMEVDFFWTPIQPVRLNDRFSLIAPDDVVPEGISDSQLLTFAEQIEIPPHILRDLEQPFIAGI